MSKYSLVEEINLELRTLPASDLREILSDCQARNTKHAALRRELRDALPPVIIPKRQRKTGTFREVRTIRNRGGIGGKTYQWAFDVTYEDGKRVKSKSIGRVK